MFFFLFFLIHLSDPFWPKWFVDNPNKCHKPLLHTVYLSKLGYTECIQIDFISDQWTQNILHLPWQKVRAHEIGEGASRKCLLISKSSKHPQRSFTCQLAHLLFYLEEATWSWDNFWFWTPGCLLGNILLFIWFCTCKVWYHGRSCPRVHFTPQYYHQDL